MTTEIVFPRHVRVDVYPFSRQRDGEDLIIGRADLGSFAAVPAEAVEILDQLAEGRTVGEVQDLYETRYGETLDLEDFLRTMASKGLVRPHSPETRDAPAIERSPRGLRFSWISQRFARALFSAPMLVLQGVLIVAGVVLVLTKPGLLPGRQALYFTDHRTLKTLTVLLLGYATLLIHELGHLLAARAVGVESSLGLSHRLWVLVAETDLTGLWAIPKKKRYLPLLAGPMFDAASVALLLLVLAAAGRWSWNLPGTLVELARALVVVYWLRLLWQCFFFVRTDFYYVLASLFDCKNLLGDTEAFLRNGFARLFSWVRFTDQSHLPPTERRMIRVYGVVWLIGRAAAFWVLFFVTIPLFAAYSKGIGASIRSGYAFHHYEFLDAVFLVILFFIPLVAGLALWMSSLYRSWRIRWSTQAKSYI